MADENAAEIGDRSSVAAVQGTVENLGRERGEAHGEWPSTVAPCRAHDQLAKSRTSSAMARRAILPRMRYLPVAGVLLVGWFAAVGAAQGPAKSGNAPHVPLAPLELARPVAPAVSWPAWTSPLD